MKKTTSAILSLQREVSEEERTMQLTHKFRLSDQQPAPQPAPQTRGIASGISGVLGGRQQQLDQQERKALGYSSGGKIHGPGTPTSDSIPATVKETGEGIAVSTTERILSAAQDAMLEDMARKSGFESLDAMLEAGTGKPVGPTIKGGKKAAAGGWNIDNNPDEYAKAMQQQVLGRDAQAASPAPAASPLVDGIRPWYAGASTADSRTGLEMERERRAGALSAGAIGDPVKSALQFGVIGGESPQPATAKTGVASSAQANNPIYAPSANRSGEANPNSAYGQGSVRAPGGIGSFAQDGKTYNVAETSQDNIRRVTGSNLSSPLYTNIDPAQGVAGLKAQAIGGDAASVNEGLARYQRANDIRQSMIDSQPQGGIAVMAGNTLPGGVSVADWNKNVGKGDAMAGMGSRTRATYMAAMANNEAQLRGQDMAKQTADSRDVLTARGQDLQSASDMARIAGNPLDNQTKQLSLTQAQKIAQLQDNASAGDPKALAELKTRGIIKSPEDQWELGYRKTKDANTGLETQEPVVVTKDFGKQQQMTPQQEYQNAIASAKGDPAKIKMIQDRARQNGVIQ